MPRPRSFDVGVEVVLNGRIATIGAQVSVDEVLVQFKDNGDKTTASTASLEMPGIDKTPPARPLETLSEKDWETAKFRFAAIEPLIDLQHDVTASTKVRAKEVGKSARTLRRWYEIYLVRRRVSDLAPRSHSKRKKRLSRKVETIIKDTIQKYYLRPQKPSIKKTVDEVLRLCRNARVRKLPHRNTIRARINEVSEKETARRRKGKKAAQNAYGEIKGEFPHATYPLAVVQIDHTKLDIEIVDDEARESIGRPWITLAIDVFSRMIAGLYVSLDHPSAFSVGLCVRHSVLPKEEELRRLGIDAKWPVWGVMDTIHVDNAREFHSATFKKSCQEHDITIEWRPVGKPDYGGHIERLMGTVAEEIHALPGSTFSNIQQKGTYNSTAQAAMTLSELQQWLLRFFVGIYHRRIHKGIGVSPLERWEEGIFGIGRQKGIGLIPQVADPERFSIDFLPGTERTVQRAGITWDGIEYHSPAIREWINAKKGGQKVKFVIRRDPRDISRIQFLDPKLNDYIEIPYRKIWRPSVSLWEYREALRRGRESHAEMTVDDAAFEVMNELNRIVDEAKSKTRSQRRKNQKKKNDRTASKFSPEAEQKVANDDGLGQIEDEYFDLSDEDFTSDWEPMYD